MREMVLRERAERVAHVRAIASIAARVTGVDVDRVFGDIVADYASEVFQEAYDPVAIARKARRLRQAQAAIRQRQAQDAAMVRRLERMETLGQVFDKSRGRHGKPSSQDTNDSKPLKHKLRSKRG